ncbi:hypothetical protein ONZ45_g13105 [Pleurotus djamor]|nr:hypothetical protein ONZ45_g13105 [Pleurotus djamor]
MPILGSHHIYFLVSPLSDFHVFATFKAAITFKLALRFEISCVEMSSAASKVLSTPKLLRKIFCFSRQTDNASNLLVNKTWSEEVLNVEWSELDGPVRLFDLLAPLVPSSADPDLYAFSRPLEPADWECFNRYAPRVKTIIQDSIHFDASVYTALSKHKNQTCNGVFPNVDYVGCPMHPDLLNLYLHPGLTSLVICVDPDHRSLTIQLLESSFSVITQRVASSLGVLYLNLELDDDMLRSSESLLVSVLGEMKGLTEVTIPPHWVSERITLALASLPKLVGLETLELQDDSVSTEIIPTFSPLLGSHSFPLLTTLSLLIPFENAIPSFLSWGRSASLLSLYLDSGTFETPERYKTMVRVISNAFPSLQRLRISAVSEDIPLRTPTPRLAFDALEPLLRLGFLDLLRVCYTTPLYLTNDDLSKICWTLESITLLHLNPTPPIRTTSSLHLSCLAEAHFTYSLLERLGIYVNTSFEGFRGLRIAKDLPLFAHLTDLNFGYSSLRHEAVGPVVELLSEILPDGCKIDAEDPHSELKYGLGDLPPQWQQVSSIVPALRQAVGAGDIGEVSRLRIMYSPRR